MTASAPRPPDQHDARGQRGRDFRVWPAIVIVLAGIAVRAPLLPRAGFQFDQTYFAWWGFITGAEGFDAAYRDADLGGRVFRRCNIPPLNLFGFWMAAKLYPLVCGRNMTPMDVQAMDTWAPPDVAARASVLFKLPATLADLATAVLLWVMLRRRVSDRLAFVVGLLYVLHPAVIFNSAVWGQVDAIHTLFMLLSLDAALRQRPAQMTAWATLGVLAKPQAILLAPVWVAMLLFGCSPTPLGARLRRIAVSAGVAVGIAALVVAPFGFDQLRPSESNETGSIYRAYFEAVGYYPLSHLNGFSAWFLANPLDMPHLENLRGHYMRDDRPWIALLTRRHMGMAMLGIATMVVMVMLYRRKCDAESMRWAAMVLPLAFFLLPTQIHERYLFPAIALGAWAAMPTRRWWFAWGVIGLVAYVNLAWAWPSLTRGRPVPAAAPFSLATPAVGIVCVVALIAVFILQLRDCKRLAR